jgi:hypothetical protein
LAPDHPVSSSLELPTTRENRWDRDAIVRAAARPLPTLWHPDGENRLRRPEGARDAHPVRFGVVEALNTTIKAVLRRARGMRQDAILLLKLKWTTASPIRSAMDLARFLQPQGLYSNR